MIRIARPLRVPLLVVLLALVTALGCGGDPGSSPTSPSSGSNARGAVISGRVTGLAARAAAPDVSTTMATSSVTVTVSGTDISSVIDGNGDFTLTGVPPGDVQLRFTGNGVSAAITLTGVQASDRITVTIALNGNGARLESEHRGKNDDDQDENDNEMSGTVSNLTGTCPAITFTVRSTIVKTSSATRFEDLTCPQIASGTRVEVKGTRQADGAILATRVERD